MVEEGRGQLGTVRNAALLLDLLAEGSAFQQLTELAERSGLTLPTVHRLLRSLVAAGFVEQDVRSSRYSLGPQLVRLSERYLDRLPVLGAVSPYLVELRNTTKATVLVALLVSRWVVYVDRIDGEDVGGLYRETHRVRHAADAVAGRVLLGHADPEAWRDAVAEGDGQRPVSNAERADWAAASHLVGEGGGLHHAVEVAVPILTGDGRALASLSASASAETFTPDVLSRVVVPQMLRAATATTRTLGRG